MPDHQTARIAVFIDFENIALSAVNRFSDFDLGLLLKPIQQRGRVTIKRAYGDWSRLGKYRDALRENAVDLVQLYSYNYQQGGKNRADIRLVIDVMESMATLDHIDTIVIVSGDSDFSPLVSKAREYGKYTIGVGVQETTSDLLIKACDEFIFYNDLVEKAYEQLKGRREEAPAVEAPPVEMAAAAAEAPSPSAAQPTARMQPPASDDPPPPRVEQTVRPLPLPPAGALPPPPPATITVVPQHLQSAPPTPARPEREALRYFFDDLRLPVIAPDARFSILGEMLNVVEPDMTLNQAVDRLKARYDYANLFRKREDIRAVAKLAYRAGLFEFGRERASLSSCVLRVRSADDEWANRQADRTLLHIALEANLTLTPQAATNVLFAPARDERYCKDLLDEMADEGVADYEKGEFFIRQTDAVSRLLEAPELAEVRRDLQHFALGAGERVSLDDADRLFDQASEWRKKDFVASANAAVRGLKMYAELYRRGEPGLGPDEFLWGAASYCSARAGVAFRNRDYISARQYYLAFFWILQEGDFAWELLRPLIPSLLSYYWMTLSHELGVRVGSFSGHTPPAETVIGLVQELNGFGMKKMEDLGLELATVNAALLRSLTAQVEAADQDASQQRAVAVLKGAHERFKAA
jgi:uncharacterized LabA/DUF88 family protein